MLSTSKRFVVIALCLNLAACTSLHTVESWRDADSSGQAKSAKQLAPGDKVVVTTTGNDRVELVVSAIEPAAIVGTDRASSQPRSISRDQVLRVEREEVSVLKVAGWILVIGTNAAGVALSHAAFFPQAP